MAELERAMRQIVRAAHDRADLLIDELLAENGDVDAQRRVDARFTEAMVQLELDVAPATVVAGYLLGQLVNAFVQFGAELGRGFELARAVSERGHG